MMLKNQIYGLRRLPIDYLYSIVSRRRFANIVLVVISPDERNRTQKSGVYKKKC